MTQRLHWSELTPLQVGRYAKYFVKMEFTLHRFDVVGDKGIDFVIRKHKTRYNVQVKSSRNLNYIFFTKEKFDPSENLLAAIVLFTDDEPPALYLVPSRVWLKPNALFVSRDYEGKESKPEWGVNLSKRNLALLAPFAFEDVVKDL